MRRKKTTDQYAEEKRWVFSFDLKEESEHECLRKRVPDRLLLQQLLLLLCFGTSTTTANLTAVITKTNYYYYCLLDVVLEREQERVGMERGRGRERERVWLRYFNVSASNCQGCFSRPFARLSLAGSRCETDINECFPSPCSAQGTLRCNDLVNRYECVCKPGYTGVRCEVRL